MRVRLVALAVCAVVVAGCGEESKGVPAACRQGSDAVHTALKGAPDMVRLEGTTPISACIKDTSTGGEMSDVGTAYVTVAEELADVAATKPNSQEALQLGYLIGAVERSRRGSQGVGYELGRRLANEAARVDQKAPLYRSGLRAGRNSG